MQSIVIYLITTLQLVAVHAAESFRDSAAAAVPSELAKPNYHDDDDDFSQCVPIREPVCQGLQYTETRMPNWVKMTSQEEAAKRMIDYRSLLNINCSHYLNLFLCTIYFPMCTRVLVKSALKPCKPLCVHVRNRCEPIMQQFQFNWPAELACDDLPEPPALCIEPDGYALDSKKPVLPNLSAIAVSEAESGAGNPNLRSLQRLYPQLEEILRQRNQEAGNLNSLIQAAVSAVDSSTGSADQDVVCTGAEFTARHFFNNTCLVYCGADLQYRATDKSFARTWLLAWSCICLASTILTFLTFFTDTSRLRYPERPVIYLAVCYFALAFGYVLQYCLGAELVTCKSINPIEAVGTGSTETETAVESATQKYLLKSGQEGTWCTVGFLILYYFGMASNLWWVMLSLAWYLSTARKWGHEGVESVSSVFHMITWALPAIQAILILILHKIDADELTGTCYTGFHNENVLLFGVLLPQTLYLALGLILLSVGFAAVFQVRQKLKVPSRVGDPERDSRRRLEKSIAKLGVFAVLYTFPMACLLAGNLYEYVGQPKWRAALAALHREHPQCLSPRGIAWGIDKCHPKSSPSPEAALLRIFMSLVVGITSGMWVWANKKSIHSWRNFFCRRGRWRSGAFEKREGNLQSRRTLAPSASLRAPQLLTNPDRTATDTAPAVARPTNPFGGTAFPPDMSRNYQTAAAAGSSYPAAAALGCQTCLTARERACAAGMSPNTPSYTSSQTADLFPLNVDGLTDCYLQRSDYPPSASSVSANFPPSYPYTTVHQQTSHHHSLHAPVSGVNSALGMQQFNGRPVNSASTARQ